MGFKFPDGSEVIVQMIITAARESSGKMMVYNSQGGAMPVDYETAVELRDALNEYLQDGQELIDLRLQLFVTQMSQRENLPRPKTERKLKPGYIYLLRSEVGHYKIGRTTAPEQRLQNFGVKLPFRVEYVCLIKTDDMPRLEGELHFKFAAKRLDGEWFQLLPEDIDYIRGLAS